MELEENQRSWDTLYKYIRTEQTAEDLFAMVVVNT